MSGIQIKTVPCRFVPVTKCHYRKFGLASNCRLNLIQCRVSISIWVILNDITAKISSWIRALVYICTTRRSRCSSPNIRRLTPRVPDVAQGANWWRNVYTRRFAATYTCTRACAHTRLLASSSYESTSVHGRWPSSRSWNQTRHRSRGRGVVSTQCVFHPKIAFCSPSVSYPEVFFLFRFSLRSSQCSRITLCSSSDT